MTLNIEDIYISILLVWKSQSFIWFYKSKIRLKPVKMLYANSKEWSTGTAGDQKTIITLETNDCDQNILFWHVKRAKLSNEGIICIPSSPFFKNILRMGKKNQAGETLYLLR